MGHRASQASVRCPSYGEFGCSKMTEKQPGPAPGVRLIEVSVKRELTVTHIMFVHFNVETMQHSQR